MDKSEKTKVIETYRRDKSDTEVQIALLSARITELTEHLQPHTHDESSRRGLLKLVGRRRRLLAYLQRKNYDSYVDIADKLNIRRK